MAPHVAALPIVVALIAASVLVAAGSFAPRWLNDGLGGLVALAVMALSAVLLVKAARAPFAYWIGGWHPSHGVTVGVSLSVDQVGAGMALLAAVLVLAALAYSMHYFDAIQGLFHGLMLLFLAAMTGFCLTGDLFNLVVFFELMSTVAYALTAYRIEERAPIQGAINFAISNSVAGFAMFIGVAMLYARTGALNLAQIGFALDHHGADPLVVVAMVLLFLGFLTKAAAVPLHFWLADAHAVAPIPVCVLFSGVMVELGVYAVARLWWEVFAGPLGSQAVSVRAILVALGVLTALLGASMCVVQRHIKRLLAFSTVSHVGMFVCGVGLLDPRGLAGVMTYVVGHGFAKGALFMCAGILLHRFATVDEYDLHGRGRSIPFVGVLMVVGALLLAALPPLTTFQGKSLLDEAATGRSYDWLPVVFVVVSALTGGAVLRIAGRVFVGWGPSQGPYPDQERAAEERIDETRDRRDHTPWVMMAVPAILLVCGIVAGLVPGLVPSFERAAARFTDHAAYAAWVLHGAHVPWPVPPPSHVQGVDMAYGVAAVVGAILVGALGLFGRPLRLALPEVVAAGPRAAVHGLRVLHSGHIGDYIAWWTAGASVLGGICLVVLT